MSKEIAYTVGGKRIVWLIAIIAAFATFATVAAQTPTPAPKLQHTKTVFVSGNYIQWTLAVTNTGNLDSTSQTIQDTLPAGADWEIVDDTIGCALAPSLIPNRVKLDCNKFIVERRHLNEAEDNFLDGFEYVSIAGVVDRCGVYVNTAVFNAEIIRSTSAEVVCPATPTPVPPTATPTMSPTPIPATNTPIPDVPTSTPISTQPTRIIPLPPRTGNSVEQGNNSYILLYTALGLGALAFGIGGTIVARRSR